MAAAVELCYSHIYSKVVSVQVFLLKEMMIMLGCGN